MSRIMMHTGNLVSPEWLTVEEVDIEDISHALSNICRYGGHCREFYSVAEHSVLVHKLVKDAGGNVDERKWALMHDAGEAYLGDIPRPIKYASFMDPFRRIEDEIIDEVGEAFGLSPNIPQIVHEMDDKALGIEIAQIMPPGAANTFNIEPIVNVPPLGLYYPRAAKELFLQVFHEEFNG